MYYGKWVTKYFYPVEATDRPATRILLNNGLVDTNLAFTDGTATRMPAPSGGDLFCADAIAVVDVDGDGDLDLILTGQQADLSDPTEPEYVAGSKTRILLNNGSGVFTNATSTMFPAPKTGDAWTAGAMTLGDVDGDDDLDLVIVTNGDLDANGTALSSMRLFLNASGKFTEATSRFPAVRTDGNGEMWRGTGVYLANANSDDALDLVVVDESIVYERHPVTGLFTVQVSSTRILRNDGNGNFSDDTKNALPLTGSDRYLGTAVVLGDMDDDDDNDLIVTTDLSAYSGDGAHPTRQLEFK
jgi:hypothetical protein